MAVHSTITNGAVRWIIEKLKFNHDENAELQSRLSEMEYMVVHNDFYAPLAIDENGTLLVDEDGKAILADWKF